MARLLLARWDNVITARSRHAAVFCGYATHVSGGAPAVQRIFANVGTRSTAERIERLERLRAVHEARDPVRFKRVEEQQRSPDRYEMLVRLSAGLSDGRRIHTPGIDFSHSGASRGIGAIHHRYKGPPLPEDETEQRAALDRYHVGPWDIESAIDQMLGRDPNQHRPPRLSWTNLIKALGDEGIVVGEDDLIATPLTVEYAPEVTLFFDQA
jgi:hypothetical protein